MNTNDVKDMIEVLRSNGYECSPHSSIVSKDIKIKIYQPNNKAIINIITLFSKDLSRTELIELIELFNNSYIDGGYIYLKSIHWPEGLL